MATKKYLDESGLTLVWGKITGLTGSIDTKVSDLSGSVKSDYYTKTEVDNKISGIKNDMASVFTFKGTVANLTELNEKTGNTTGDVWHVTNAETGKTNAEYVWNGEDWEELGTAIDLSGYQQNLTFEDSGTGNTVTSVSKSGNKVTITKGYAISSVTGTGSGNAFTTVSVSDGVLTLTKGASFADSTHTHTASDITDFATSVDARIKLEGVNVNGTPLTIAEKTVNLTITGGTTNGTISVNNTNIPVKGLGSAAYTNSNAYATAAQGTLANTALQPDDIDAITTERINAICV